MAAGEHNLSAIRSLFYGFFGFLILLILLFLAGSDLLNRLKARISPPKTYEELLTQNDALIHEIKTLRANLLSANAKLRVCRSDQGDLMRDGRQIMIERAQWIEEKKKLKLESSQALSDAFKEGYDKAHADTRDQMKQAAEQLENEKAAQKTAYEKAQAKAAKDFQDDKDKAIKMGENMVADLKRQHGNTVRAMAAGHKREVSALKEDIIHLRDSAKHFEQLAKMDLKSADGANDRLLKENKRLQAEMEDKAMTKKCLQIQSNMNQLRIDHTFASDIQALKVKAEKDKLARAEAQIENLKCEVESLEERRKTVQEENANLERSEYSARTTLEQERVKWKAERSLIITANSGLNGNSSQPSSEAAERSVQKISDDLKAIHEKEISQLRGELRQSRDAAQVLEDGLKAQQSQASDGDSTTIATLKAENKDVLAKIDQCMNRANEERDRALVSRNTEIQNLEQQYRSHFEKEFTVAIESRLQALSTEVEAKIQQEKTDENSRVTAVKDAEIARVIAAKDAEITRLTQGHQKRVQTFNETLERQSNILNNCVAEKVAAAVAAKEEDLAATIDELKKTAKEAEINARAKAAALEQAKQNLEHVETQLAEEQAVSRHDAEDHESELAQRDDTIRDLQEKLRTERLAGRGPSSAQRPNLRPGQSQQEEENAKASGSDEQSRQKLVAENAELNDAVDEMFKERTDMVNQLAALDNKLKKAETQKEQLEIYRRDLEQKLTHARLNGYQF